MVEPIQNLAEDEVPEFGQHQRNKYLYGCLQYVLGRLNTTMPPTIAQAR